MFRVMHFLLPPHEDCLTHIPKLKHLHIAAVAEIVCGILMSETSFFCVESVRWPMFVIAILASVVGSQAIISGTFSIISQSQSLGCFPRVKVVHTSNKIHGQIYIPEVNWVLMILCVVAAIGFRDTKHLGNASGTDCANRPYNFARYLTLVCSCCVSHCHSIYL